MSTTPVSLATLLTRAERIRRQRRDRYALARSLGLSSYIAAQVHGWSEQAIRDLAAQQAQQTKQDP